ncbi:MAG: hypothetical protein K2X09_00295 [Rickettsiales bacterium]|nr:hypothetical protein [Rickettsiales bacterium]
MVDSNDTAIEINNTPMINSANLSKVVTNPHIITSLLSRLHAGESGKHRSLGAGLHPGASGMRGGNDGIDISLDVVQGWLDSGELKLRPEPRNPTEAKLYGSPDQFLEDNGLTRPEEK